MIHYQLRCSQDHAFDGWFKDSAAFEAQAKSGLLECPECGDARVRRALMAPALARAQEAASPAPPVTKEVTTAAPPGEKMPAQIRAVLQRLRAEVEKNCDYVGPSFAEEARRIHSGESDRRGIYGETTPEQAERLAEEGIEIAKIPWVPRSDG